MSDKLLKTVEAVANLVADLSTKVEKVAKEKGPAGDRGLSGARGAPGVKGLDGKDGVNGPKGLDGGKGPKGDTGEKGDTGDTGPAPKHKWDGTKLAFQQPSGVWGKSVDLKGPAGTGKGAGSGALSSNNPGGGSGVGIDDEAVALDKTYSSSKIEALVASGVADQRALAKWFEGGIDGKTIGWIGDSTTWQMDPGGQNLTAENGPARFIANLYPSLKKINERNFGSNGAFFSGFVVPGPQTDGLDEVAAAMLDVAIICYGINDFRGGLAPGAGAVPDYRVAYGAPGNVQAALLCQTWMAECVTRLRAANPDICIIFRMPNGAAVSNVNLANGVTSQNMMDVLRLAYRGDVDLDVPSPEALADGVLVYDTMGLIFGQTAYQHIPPFLDADGLHPNLYGYRMTILGIANLLEGPPASSIGNARDSRLAKYRELSVAHGNAVIDPLVFTESGEWYRVYDATVFGDLKFYWDLGMGPTPTSVNHAWGGGIGEDRSSAAPAGIAHGDRILWANGDIETVAQFPNNNSGLYRFNNNEISGSEFLPGYQQPDDIGKSKHGTGSQMVVYRHIYGNSLAARYNAYFRRDGTPEQKTSASYKYAYRITAPETNDGSMKFFGIGGELAENGMTGSAHTITVDDVLCIPGLDGGSNAPIVDFLGTKLTGATFAKNNNEITITLAGFDFRNFVSREGFLLSNT